MRDRNSPAVSISQRPGHRALRRGRVSVPGQVYFVTTVCHGRQAHFASDSVARAGCRVLADPASWCDAVVLAWVLMPDHAHWLVELGEMTALPALVGRVKSRISRGAAGFGYRPSPLWARGYHDRALRDGDDARAAARYLVGNPVRAGIVGQVGDYPYWDAVWL